MTERPSPSTVVTERQRSWQRRLDQLGQYLASLTKRPEVKPPRRPK